MHMNYLENDSNTEETFVKHYDGDWDSFGTGEKAGFIIAIILSIIAVILINVGTVYLRNKMTDQCENRNNTFNRNDSNNINQATNNGIYIIDIPLRPSTQTDISIIDQLAIERMMNRQTARQLDNNIARPQTRQEQRNYSAKSSQQNLFIDLPPAYDQLCKDQSTFSREKELGEPDCPPPSYWNAANSNYHDDRGYR